MTEVFLQCVEGGMSLWRSIVTAPHQQNSFFCKVEKLNNARKVAQKIQKVSKRALMGAYWALISE